MSSTFESTRETVELLVPHKNAENLEIVVLRDIGYTIISQKGLYNVGDEVLLMMPDSIIPPRMVEHFGLGYLYKGSRVKTVKLRGIVSQALILPFTQIRDYIINTLGVPALNFQMGMMQGASLNDILGITKYDEPEPTDENSTGRLPDGCERYDIEGIEKFGDVYRRMLPLEVVVMEKMEGTNLAWHLFEDDTETGCKRSSAVGEDSFYSQVARERGWDKFAKFVRKITNAKTITLRGELVGENVQGNIYNMKGKGAFLFDIKLNGRYIDFAFMRTLVLTYNGFIAPQGNYPNIVLVPVVYEGKLVDFAPNIEEAKILSNGQSVIAAVAREGVVIRPLLEVNIDGERQLKAKSPEYLAKQK